MPASESSPDDGQSSDGRTESESTTDSENVDNLIGARVTDEMKERLDLLAWQASEPGDPVPKSKFVREALEEYLPPLEELEGDDGP